MSVELSTDEVYMIHYALQNAATCRLQQAIECRRELSGAVARSDALVLETDANNHFKLAAKLSEYVNKS